MTLKPQPRSLSFWNKVVRSLWQVVWLCLFRPSPVLVHSWRRALLRMFGAHIGRRVHVYPSARIWAPWNLEMLEGSCLSHHVDCYCVDPVTIGRSATVSQYSYLCSASHDYNRPEMPLVSAPILIDDHAWVTAGVYVGPGVTIGEGAVVGARSVVTKDVPRWTVVAGHPPVKIGDRPAAPFATASRP